MAHAQDSSDPTGVRDDSPEGGSAVARARDRKANAALQLVMDDHASWIEVAEVLGYPTARAAKVAVEGALEKELHSGDREVLRRYASAKLDRLLRAVWGKAIDAENPDQMSAVREARTTLVEHIKLWGLAAPAEVVVSSPSEREIESWVAGVVSRSMPQLEEADIFGSGEVIEGEVVEE